MSVISEKDRWAMAKARQLDADVFSGHHALLDGVKRIIAGGFTVEAVYTVAAGQAPGRLAMDPPVPFYWQKGGAARVDLSGRRCGIDARGLERRQVRVLFSTPSGERGVVTMMQVRGRRPAGQRVGYSYVFEKRWLNEDGTTRRIINPRLHRGRINPLPEMPPAAPAPHPGSPEANPGMPGGVDPGTPPYPSEDDTRVPARRGYDPRQLEPRPRPGREGSWGGYAS